jgi:phenylalanine-4-hydroxylase
MTQKSSKCEKKIGFTDCIKTLPSYLKVFVIEQDYDRYTARDHAVWRFIMRQARELFKTRAHSVYLDGLARTGIPISRIPNIKEMDKTLQKFSWGAVCVRGFIPPQIFLEFFAHKLLPIAADMRSLEHMAYTPAPDIVHEAAGHAPILADSSYAQFLEDFGKIASKAIYSDEDIKLYDAIRDLSDKKENADSTASEIKAAEKYLEDTVAAMTWVSEAAMMARMFWWTAEYGLVDSKEGPKIYGAGLLSSLGEGQSCFDSSVKKMPFAIGCTKQGFDITKPQPQLFVAKDFSHLGETLKEFEKTLSFKNGNNKSLDLAKKAHTTTTIAFDTKFELTGTLIDYENIGVSGTFLRWKEPLQLSYKGSSIPEYEKKDMERGFMAFVGSVESFSKDLDFVFQKGKEQEFSKESFVDFSAGMKVKGKIAQVLSFEENHFLIEWESCEIFSDSKNYRTRSDGSFTMIVASKIVSVYGGACDRNRFNFSEQGVSESSPARKSPFRKKELELFNLYKRIRVLRDACEDEVVGYQALLSELRSLTKNFLKDYKKEWLLGVEIFELFEQYHSRRGGITEDFIGELKEFLSAERNFSKEIQPYISSGMLFARKRDADPLRSNLFS